MVKRLGLLAAAILVFGLSDAFATWQQPDILIYKGSMYRIYSEPMEAYFEASPSKRPAVCERNSSLWRGYVATIIVVNSELILKDITIPTAPGNGDPWCQKESVLERVAADGKPLKLNWISGFLVSFDGSNRGDSYTFEFLETFERYSVFEFTSGNLAKAKHLSNKEYKSFRTRQFNAFKKTPDYQRLIKGVPKPKVAERNGEILRGIFFHTKRFLVE